MRTGHVLTDEAIRSSHDTSHDGCQEGQNDIAHIGDITLGNPFFTNRT